mgnify:CR=1 FL=1
MKISVIVTNYNYEKWLRRCIRSLINQSFDDYEIIIIDDFSTDNSRNILLEYQDVDKIKLVFNKSNVGVQVQLVLKKLLVNILLELMLMIMFTMIS